MDGDASTDRDGRSASGWRCWSPTPVTTVHAGDAGDPKPGLGAETPKEARPARAVSAIATTTAMAAGQPARGRTLDGPSSPSQSTADPQAPRPERWRRTLPGALPGGSMIVVRVGTAPGRAGTRTLRPGGQARCGRRRVSATCLTGEKHGHTISPTMHPTAVAGHALAETAQTYGVDPRGSHTKLSISLPTELVEQLRVASSESGVSLSGVVAAVIRRSIASADQERLDRALELDAADNEAWANETLAMTARAWANLEW